jgi:predicted 2-oxoglutarate/Fe(II)-dependent dioxygenase YbiX
MRGGYTKESILSPEDVQEALDVYHQTPMEKYWQYYNLYKVERRDITGDISNMGFMKTLHKRARTRSQVSQGYFLKYPPGSFTKIHSDNGSDITIVTLLESKDLVGGHSITQAVYGESSRPQGWHAVRGDNGYTGYGDEIVTDVVNINDGESLCYGPDLLHGVSKVYQGHRIVLVTWWSNEIRK